MHKWYVVYTKPSQEVVAEESLRRQGYTTYLPRLKQPRRHRGKWKEIIEPLFSRYLFIQISLGTDNISPIRSTRGVIGIVRFSSEPVAVSNTIIDALMQKTDLRTGTIISNQPLFKKGDKVTILDGPLARLEGIYQAANGQKRAIILIDILGQSQRVYLKQDALSPSL